MAAILMAEIPLADVAPWVPFASFASVVWARPRRLEPNIRESCRQILIGAYIAAYDDRERQRHFIRISREKIAEIQTAISKAQAQYQALKQQLSRSTYEASLTEKTEAAYSAWQSFEAQKTDLEKQLSQAVTDHERALAKEKKLRKDLEPLFTIKRFEDRPDGGYPIESQYKSPCPPYRALCLLPPQDIEALSRIRIDGELPEPCRRYISLGRSTPENSSPSIPHPD